MKPSINLALVLLLLLRLHPAAFSQSGTFPRLQPDPSALEFQSPGKDHRYSWTELARISLWASGAARETSLQDANLEKIRTAVDALQKSPDLPVTGKEKAEFILGFMHKNLLKTYSLTQTRIDTLLSNGRFNCVSSAVLYMILCESAGLETSGVMTKDHAFVTVHTGEPDIDVETTNPYGFDPGNRKESHDQFGKLTGFAYVPARNYRDRQTISRIELISLILNNRIAELESRNNYAEAVPLAIDRAALLTGNPLAVNAASKTYESLFTDPRRDLMDRLFNYGSMLLKAGKEEDCLAWAAAASPLYPDENRWQEFILAAANNSIVKFTKAGKMTEARNFLESQKSLLNRAGYAQLDAVLIDAELLGSANKIRAAAEGDAVVIAVEQARSSGSIGEKRADEILTFTIQKTAAALCAAPARDWRAAIHYIEKALARFGARLGGNRELEQALQTYRGNLAADFHNRFASAWNKKNFEEAERILIEGLAELPNDRQLLSDMETVRKQRQ